MCVCPWSTPYRGAAAPPGAQISRRRRVSVWTRAWGLHHVHSTFWLKLFSFMSPLRCHPRDDKQLWPSMPEFKNCNKRALTIHGFGKLSSKSRKTLRSYKKSRASQPCRDPWLQSRTGLGTNAKYNWTWRSRSGGQMCFNGKSLQYLSACEASRKHPQAFCRCCRRHTNASSARQAVLGVWFSISMKSYQGCCYGKTIDAKCGAGPFRF